MRKLALCFAVLLFFAVSGVAQSDTSNSSTSTSSTTTTTTKTKKAKSSKTAEGEHQVTGCLAGPNDEGVYTLTNGHYTKGLEVGGNDELKDHVGHQVTLKGTWGSAADIGEKSNTAENEKAEKHMKVSSIKMVSDSCPASNAKKGKKSKAAAPTS